MSSLAHPAVAKVAAALAEAGQHHAADNIRILPGEVRTASQAAAALNVPIGAIANSLVFRSVDQPLLALTSGAHRADTELLAELAGVETIRMAEPSFVKEHTGQVIGGVAPIGHPHQLATFIDATLRNYEVIWAAAGHAKSLFPTTFDDLVQFTGGKPGQFAMAAQKNPL